MQCLKSPQMFGRCLLPRVCSLRKSSAHPTKLCRNFANAREAQSASKVQWMSKRLAVAGCAFSLGVAGLYTQESKAFFNEEVTGHHTVYGWIRPGHNRDVPVPDNDTRILLISDVDDTMTGCNKSLNAFNKFWLEHHVPRNSCLVYNTARPCGYGGVSHSKSGFTHLVGSGRYDLMRPDVLITCEGTEVFWLDSDADTPAERDMEWHEHLSEFWDQEAVERRVLPHDEGLAKQLGVSGPFNSDDTFRVAVTIGDKARAIDLADRVRDDLGPHYNVFWTEAWVRGIYLVSVLPIGAGKGHAAEHVAGKINIGLDRTVWAGDSDNDLQMLETHGMRGIIVGNSYSERLRAAATEKEFARFFQAKSSYAAGVLEGLAFLF